jgi:hypothetical protein
VSPELIAVALQKRPEHQSAIVALCAAVLDPLRDALGPIRITSGYRTDALNTAIGGSKTSEHLSGRAADIVLLRDHETSRIADVARRLRLPVRQFLEYHPTHGGHVHLSYRVNAGPPKRQYLYKIADGAWRAQYGRVL